MPSFADHKRAMYDEHLQLDKELVHQGYLMNEIDFVKCECVRIFFFFSGKRGFFRRCVFLHADKKSFKC